MIKVNVIVKNNRWKNYIKNPNNFLNNKFKKLRSNIKFLKNKKFEISIMLTGDKDMKLLNKKFRKKNKSTDVLSFPFYEKKKIDFFLKNKKNFYLGDLVVNLNKIVDKKDKNKTKTNFDTLWIHGFLHLLGSRHKSDKDHIKMNKLEKKLFKSVN